ncbi:GNAT family N-acetyltransferase [Candidatus Roizmanbacteria bacterium]|nr:GNAT family N-acetyltransferase [Candidatus Roizmanbacteria bacterium]
MVIRELLSSDIESINKIAKSLHPKWFTSDALKNISIDVQIDKCYVAESNNNIVGFIIFSSQDGEVRINWLGVNPDFHREGTGSKLLERVINFVKEIGSKKIIVETVVEQIPKDGSYDETMKFYMKQGFMIFKKYPEEHFKEFTFTKGLLEKQIK